MFSGMSEYDSPVPVPPRTQRDAERDLGLRKPKSISQMAMPTRPGAAQPGDYLEGLNPEQKDAVVSTEGPLLVLAGAGTGKTRVLTCRLAHILNRGMAYPSQILSVTFTNKAAREMRHRVSDLLGQTTEGLPWLGTFHSIAAKILRIHAELVGLKSNFTILDTDDQIRLLKQIIKAEQIDDKKWTAKYMASLIDGWKNKGLTPDKLNAGQKYMFAEGKGQLIYKTYQDRLKVLNAADFGDLLLHNLTLFQNNPDVLARYHSKFRYILVDEYQDTRIISGEIENWRSKGRKYAGVAILVRASRQMRSFEERFIQIGLPYKVIGGPRFFERLEIRDAHAYMRLLVNDTDDLAFERVVNTPKRGIGATTVQKLQRAARSMGISLEAATRELVKTDEIRGKARTSLRAFCLDLDRWRTRLGTMRHTDLAEQILDESGYTQMWRDNKDAKSAGRLENLKELIQAMNEFDTLPAYLEHISLVMDVDTSNGLIEDQVALMTLHSAKGLEFPLVFLPGWEEGMFPSQKSLDESGMAGLEEERRLAYVGITRAREQAKIYFAANRQIYGSWQSSLPSRFIDELPPDHVEAAADSGMQDSSGMAERGADNFSRSFDSASSSRVSPGWQRFQKNKSKSYGRAPKAIEGHAVRRPAKKKTSNYGVGERVFHQKFGYGNITETDGTKLTVAFDKAGEKKVLDGFVEKA